MGHALYASKAESRNGTPWGGKRWSSIGDARPIRVLVLDDHPLVRKALSDIIHMEDDMELVGEATEGEEALKMARALAPDIALLDIQLPGLSGIEVCSRLRDDDSDVRCIMLTSFGDEQTLVDSITAGASGFVLKDMHIDQIVDAIRTVAEGGLLIDPVSVAAVMKTAKRGTSTKSPLAPLTSHERQIVALIVEGMSDRQIANHIGLSEKTIRNYVSTMLSKTGLKSRTQLAVAAVREES